jgi:hypothetical protein
MIEIFDIRHHFGCLIWGLQQQPGCRNDIISAVRYMLCEISHPYSRVCPNQKYIKEFVAANVPLPIHSVSPYCQVLATAAAVAQLAGTVYT